MFELNHGKQPQVCEASMLEKTFQSKRTVCAETLKCR